jgi:hypothetical protein
MAEIAAVRSNARIWSSDSTAAGDSTTVNDIWPDIGQNFAWVKPEFLGLKTTLTRRLRH